VERLPELGRAGAVTRALRKVQQQELGKLAEVKKEVECEDKHEAEHRAEHEAKNEAEHQDKHEAEHGIEHEAKHEATLGELQQLPCEGSEAEREDSTAVESSSDGFEEIDVDSLPSLREIFYRQDLKKGRLVKEEEEARWRRRGGGRRMASMVARWCYCGSYYS